MSDKLVPKPTPETRFFWDKAALHELWLPRCVDTDRAFFPPRIASPFTGGAVEWQRASGRGKLASYLIVHRPAPGFEGEVPYVIALIELEEGPRLMANLPGTAPDPAALTIGSPVEVTFERRGDQTLPQFRLVSE